MKSESHWPDSFKRDGWPEKCKNPKLPEKQSVRKKDFHSGQKAVGMDRRKGVLHSQCEQDHLYHPLVRMSNINTCLPQAKPEPREQEEHRKSDRMPIESAGLPGHHGRVCRNQCEKRSRKPAQPGQGNRAEGAM